jgi:hypothetical protein
MKQEPKFEGGPKVNWAQKQFSDQEMAVQFIKDFWMHINPGVGERIAGYTAEQLREYTMDYRTVLLGVEVTIYRNNSGPFSAEVIDFLEIKGFIN